MNSSVATTTRAHSLAVDASSMSITAEPISLSMRIASYAELAKPRIALMVLLSMGVGYLLGAEGNWDMLTLINSGFGVVLAVVSASALNQVIERHTDAKMFRTENRPIPAGRLTATEVVIFAVVCTVVSYVYLVATVNLLTAALTLSTTFLYAFVYTPLKRYTAFCTALGAIPGAAPPVLGWVAAGGQLDLAAFSLFAILFIWQFPHFLAIAWMYQDQYAGAGLKMLPGRGRAKVVGTVALGYALVLLPISLLPTRLGLAGDVYGVIAVLLGLLYVAASIVFFREESRRNAKQLLFASLIYLPGVLLALVFDHLRLLNGLV